MWNQSLSTLPPIEEGKTKSKPVVVRSDTGSIGIGEFSPQQGWQATWHKGDELMIALSCHLVKEWQPIAEGPDLTTKNSNLVTVTGETPKGGIILNR